MRRALAWEPAERMTPAQALMHEFLTGSGAADAAGTDASMPTVVPHKSRKSGKKRRPESC